MIVLSGKKAGSPITHTAPMTAPAVEPMPPITIMATSDSETVTTKGESLNEIPCTAPASRPPPRPAMNPARAKARSLARLGSHRVAGGGVGVVAHRHRDPADAVRRSRPSTAMTSTSTARTT